MESWERKKHCKINNNSGNVFWGQKVTERGLKNSLENKGDSDRESVCVLRYTDSKFTTDTEWIIFCSFLKTWQYFKGLANELDEYLANTFQSLDDKAK